MFPFVRSLSVGTRAFPCQREQSGVQLGRDVVPHFGRRRTVPEPFLHKAFVNILLNILWDAL